MKYLIVFLLIFSGSILSQQLPLYAPGQAIIKLTETAYNEFGTELLWGELRTSNDEMDRLVADLDIARIENILKKEIIDFTNTNFSGRLWGNSEKDFFTVNYGNDTIKPGIGHYNGTELITIVKWDSIGWTVDDAAVFEKEAFFICSSLSIKSEKIVIHGRLE